MRGSAGPRAWGRLPGFLNPGPSEQMLRRHLGGLESLGGGPEFGGVWGSPSWDVGAGGPLVRPGRLNCRGWGGGVGGSSRATAAERQRDTRDREGAGSRRARRRLIVPSCAPPHLVSPPPAAPQPVPQPPTPGSVGSGALSRPRSSPPAHLGWGPQLWKGPEGGRLLGRSGLPPHPKIHRLDRDAWRCGPPRRIHYSHTPCPGGPFPQ